MSRSRSNQCTLYSHRTWTLQRTVFLQHNYAADIKKIYKKDKLQIAETHVRESDVLGDKLRDEFEAGIRDAVIWSEPTFTVCYFNPSNGEFSATADHVRRAEHSSDLPTNTISCWPCCAEPHCVVLCCRLSRQPAFTDTTVRTIDWILKMILGIAYVEGINCLSMCLLPGLNYFK